MDAYVDLRLLPDPEFPQPLLMNALFAKFHRGLVAHGEGRIGISFPEVDARRPSLGACLRLHGGAGELSAFLGSGWLAGMADHLAVGQVAPVPSGAGHCLVRRVQAKSSPERLRRRLMRRKGIGEAEAAQAIPDASARRLDLPYLMLRSASTGQQFRLFIEHLPDQAGASPGAFSAYGLSPTATLPWF